MRITVLYGGPGAEREVSLVSGKAVAAALRKKGHEVREADITPDDLRALDVPCDVVFPVLHGEWGESGGLQELLEQRGLPFVGSGSAASRLGMDKVQTKRAWEGADLPTPPWVVTHRHSPDSTRSPGRITAPCVVKAIGSGSSIDVFVCRSEPEVRRAMDHVLAAHGQVLVEKYIDGTELTVGILEDRALPPLRITTDRAFFDFEAKYAGNQAQHHFDLGLPEELVRSIQAMCLRAHQVIGARDLSRIDVMVDRDHKPYLLEINTMPGFTPQSLLPEMAARSGIDFESLVERLAERARARGVDQG
jgi:D-alanine-D-alanine ligase